MGDRPVHKLPFDPKCHELFVILYSILANLSDNMFFVIAYLKPKTTLDKIRKKTLYRPGPVIDRLANKDKRARENINVKYNI